MPFSWEGYYNFNFKLFANPQKSQEITFNYRTGALTGYEVLTNCRKMTFKDGCGYFDDLTNFPALSIINIHGAELKKINGQFICTEDSKFD